MIAGIAAAFFAVGFVLIVLIGQLSYVALIWLGLIVIPVGAIIWFWLLAYEIVGRHPDEARAAARKINDKLPFRIQKRLRPRWARLIKQSEIEHRDADK